MEYKIWTLNRSTDLLAHEDERIQRIFSITGLEVTFGTRTGTDDKLGRQLMPEDEYFVPIPIKCIGHRYLQPDRANDSKLLEQIITRYTTNPFHYFENSEFRSWWTEGARTKSGHIPDSLKPRMTTPEGVGYYDLLEPSEQHILIGYSQGGLVARYLAFLDRFVFGENKVAAVFTVSSPNQGAPFGNPANQQTVAAGLVEVLVSLLSFHEDKFKRLFEAIAKNTMFDSLYGLLAAANEDARQTKHEARDILDSAVKWLSGLHDDPNTAFAEIGANNFNDELSVLSLVNRPENVEVYTGGVISANNRLQDILQSLLMGGRSEGLLHRFVEELESQGLHLLGHLQLFGITINDNENAASQLYKTRVIVDSLLSGSEKVQSLRKSYDAGVLEIAKPLFENETIPPFAHDDVIPSVYQLLPPNDRLLGQHVNLEASHNSGKSPALAGGADNIKALQELLQRFCAVAGEGEQRKGAVGGR